MAGRPPKPTKIHQLHGTDRADRTNDAEPQPDSADVSKPPSWLKGRGRKQWKRVAPILADMNLVTVADTDALALLCDSLAEYIEARDVVSKHGATYETVTKDGSTMYRQRPEVSQYQDAWRRVLRMMTDFGMTPGSRSKVKVGGKQEADSFEEFLSNGNRSTG